MTWRTLVTCQNEPEANIWKAKLAEHNIDALVLDTNVNALALYSGMIPVRVQVQEADFIRAKRLVIDHGEDGNLPNIDLEELALSHPHPDEAFLQKCPSCRGTNISIHVDTSQGWLGRVVGKKIRKCECGYEWK